MQSSMYMKKCQSLSLPGYVKGMALLLAVSRRQNNYKLSANEGFSQACRFSSYYCVIPVCSLSIIFLLIPYCFFQILRIFFCNNGIVITVFNKFPGVLSHLLPCLIFSPKSFGGFGDLLYLCKRNRHSMNHLNNQSL